MLELSFQREIQNGVIFSDDLHTNERFIPTEIEKLSVTDNSYYYYIRR